MGESKVVNGDHITFEPKRVRLSGLFFPAPGITWEEFSDYWLHKHAKLFMSLDIVKANLTKYEQFHVSPVLSRKVSSTIAKAETPFWGVASFEAESLDKILEIFTHPDYLRVVYPDEAAILDRERTQVLAGQFATVWEA